MTSHVDTPGDPGGAPAVAPGTAMVHDHPLSKASRILAVVYGLVVLLVGSSVLFLLVTDERDDRREREAIFAELDRRTAERDASDQVVQEQLRGQREATRAALCSFIEADLKPTPELAALAAQFDCPPITPGGTPR